MDQALSSEISAAHEDNQVNEHFFNRLTNLSETHDVKASDDIYAVNGMKLVAKGTRISSRLQERLYEHKLFQPLEKNVEVEDGIEGKKLAEEATRLLDSSAPLRALGGWETSRQSPVEILGGLQLVPSLKTLLSVYVSKSPDAITHITQVALIAMGLRHKMNADQLTFASFAYASLFHDIGEMYIDPHILSRGSQSISPAEWRQLSAHPIIGQTVLKKLNGLSMEICNMIAEHHERLNGFGYPLFKQNIDRNSQILGVAEMVSGLIHKHQYPLRHAELALKIVIGEYSTAVIDQIAKARAQADQDSQPVQPLDPGTDLDQKMEALFAQLARILKAQDEIDRHMNSLSMPAQKLLRETYLRIGSIQRAFSNTGLDCIADSTGLSVPGSKDEMLVRFEAKLAVDEILWRLRELGRDMSLRSLKFSEIEIEQLQLLHEALVGKA